MTTCELIMKPITRMVEQEGKTLDEIAEAVCPKIEYGREKIIRVLKDFLGEDYLIQHAMTLKYDVDMAKLAKKRKHKSQEKIHAIEDSESGKSPDRLDVLVDALKLLLEEYTLSELKNALGRIEMGKEKKSFNESPVFND